MIAWLRYAALAVAAVVVGGLATTSSASALQPATLSPVMVTSWAWEASEMGAWSAYTVRVRDVSQRGFEGEMRLSPVGDERAWASLFRLPVELRPGEQRTFSIPLLASEARYQAEIADRSGRRVSSGEAISAQPTGRELVGLLTDVPAGPGLLVGGAGTSFSVSSRFRSARDFPTKVDGLRGLRAVAIVDFDSSTLGKDQVRALTEFVSSGGRLMVGGGTAAGKTAGPLPAELAPMAPEGSASAPLAPLAELVGRQTSSSATVAVGQVRDASVVLGVPDGFPLIVERPLGGGRVVQLAYNPLAELARKDPLAGLARDYAMARAGITPVGSPRTGAAPVPERPETAVGSSFRGLGLGLVTLILYALAAPIGHRLLVRADDRLRSLTWVPVVAVVTAAGVLVAFRAPWLPAVTDSRARLGSPSATDRADTVHLLRWRQSGSYRFTIPAGTAAATLPSPESPRYLPDTLGWARLSQPVPASAGAAAPPVQVDLREATQMTFPTSFRWDKRVLLTSPVSAPSPTPTSPLTALRPLAVCACGVPAGPVVYDFELPAGSSGGGARLQTFPPDAPVESLEVYDWAARSWRPAAQPEEHRLAGKESQGNRVRARMRAATGVGLSVVAVP